MTDYSGSRSAAESKRRVERGEHQDPDQSRPFYCRTCNAKQMSRYVPAGWYGLDRALGGPEKHQRLGLYCSLDCLIAMMPRLSGIADELGTQWVEQTQPYRRREER